MSPLFGRFGMPIDSEGLMSRSAHFFMLSFIAEVSGKKHLTGRTDLDVAISRTATP